MTLSRSKLYALAAALAIARPALSECVSYGIDFVDEGSYFINEASTENFTSVSRFEGCEQDYSDILLVAPQKEEYICSDIPTTPDDVPYTSTCPILKDEMYSGHWILLIQGNNGAGDPFAWQRDLYLTVGPQVTSTITSTVTWDITSTPIVTSTVPSTVTAIETVSNTNTVTVASVTGQKTVTPKAVTSWFTKVFTRTRQSWTKALTTITKTETLSCTVPTPSTHDKPATYTPKGVTIGAYATGVPVRGKRYDKRIDPAVARKMMRDARRRRGMPIPERLQERNLEERAADSETVTVVDPTPYNTTITHTAAATTTTEISLTTTTQSTTLPPVTVHSGKTIVTVTAPTPTKTYTTISFTTVNVVRTLYKTWTYTTTVIPTASVSACKSQGGHFKPKPKGRA